MPVPGLRREKRGKSSLQSAVSPTGPTREPGGMKSRPVCAPSRPLTRASSFFWSIARPARFLWCASPTAGRTGCRGARGGSCNRRGADMLLRQRSRTGSAPARRSAPVSGPGPARRIRAPSSRVCVPAQTGRPPPAGFDPAANRRAVWRRRRRGMRGFLSSRECREGRADLCARRENRLPDTFATPSQFP